MPSGVVRDLTRALAELGVLNPGREPAGGMWDDDQAPEQRQLSIDTLQILAAYSAGVACQVHGQALAWRLDREVGLTPGDDQVWVSLQGWLGLGREGALLSAEGRPLPARQTEEMADNWGWPTASTPRLLHGLPDWDALWLPIWRPNDGWRWHRIPRSAFQVQEMPNSHGLDELTVQAVWLALAPTHQQEMSWPALRGDHARDLWARMQAMYASGLQAIAQAVTQAAWLRAREQAHLRRQGGAMIIRHPAVQQLLEQARQAVLESAQALASVGRAGVAWPDLPARWRDRARCQLSLSAGTSAALQVFGGMGYMQDNGLEKALRDVNHLRLLAGSPTELMRAVAHWDAQEEVIA